MALTPEQLRTILEEVFEEKSRISSEKHQKHHEWLEIEIEAAQARKEMYQEIAKAAVSWSVPLILAGMTGYLSAIWRK